MVREVSPVVPVTGGRTFDRLSQCGGCGRLLRRGIAGKHRILADRRFRIDSRGLRHALSLPIIDRLRKMRRHDFPDGRGQRFVAHEPAPPGIETTHGCAECSVQPRDEFFRRLRGAVRIDVPAESCRRGPSAVSHPAGRLLQQRHADFDRIAQAEDPRRIRKRLRQEVAEQRIPAAEFQDIGPACMAGEGVAERPQGGDQLVTRPFVRRQQEFVERQRLRIHDERCRAS